MTEQAAESQAATRSRGKGFPTTPLDEARGYVAEAAKYGMSHHLDAFAGYMGHSKASGGAFNHKIAAVRDWGLIKRNGRDVLITELGQRLALPTDPEQQRKDLREAFFTCKIFEEAYSRNAKGAALAAQSFGNAAVLNLGIAATARDKFVRSFVKSAVTAGLAEDLGDKSFVLKPLAEGAAANDADGKTPEANAGGDGSNGADGSNGGDGLAARQQPPLEEQMRTPSGLRPAFKQSWEFEGGQLDIALALESPLPREAYAHIGGAMAELIGILENARKQEDS
jgi:hypothetical protein